MQTIFFNIFPKMSGTILCNFILICFWLFISNRDPNKTRVQRDQQLTTLLNILGERWMQGFWLFIRQRIEMADVYVLPNQGSVWLGAIPLIRSFYETGMVACRGSIFGRFFILSLPPLLLSLIEKILLPHEICSFLSINLYLGENYKNTWEVTQM